MRKNIFIFPPIYPVLLSLYAGLLLLFVYLMCYHTSVLCSEPGPPPGRWGLPSHNQCYSIVLLCKLTTFVELGLCALKKPNTLQVQQDLWVLVWFFKRAPQPQVIEKAEKQRMRRPCKERKKERRNKKAQGQRRGREARQQALCRGRGRRLPPGAERPGRPGICAQASACVTQLPDSQLGIVHNEDNPLPTKSGHPVECFNRFTPLKLCFNDIMKVKQAWCVYPSFGFSNDWASNSNTSQSVQFCFSISAKLITTYNSLT